MACPIDEKNVRVVLKAKKDDVSEAYVYYGDRYDAPGKDHRLKMTKEGSDSFNDYFTAILHTGTKRLRYIFCLKDGAETLWFNEEGLNNIKPRKSYFQYPYINPADLFERPNWINGRTVYQIFPDRFCNGDSENDPPSVLKWNENPTGTSFFGGDIKGIINNLDYLADLGIGVIYMTPIFLSPSNHKYDTVDYYTIDPAFGTKGDLCELVEEAHRRDIKVILDGVFNHCSNEFFAFKDVVLNGSGSKYKDWFNIYDFPVCVGEDPNYETFGNGIYTMPKFMTQNSEVREYLIKVGEYWIKEADIDGWRLDVANEVDHDFWREFRKRIKAMKPDAFIVGEVWHDALEWLRGDQFDSVMNYPWREAILDFLVEETLDGKAFGDMLIKQRLSYPPQVWPMLLNLLGSHDTPRMLTLCADKKKMMLAIVLQMTYPGLPMIYYGDEIGIEGKGDPDCRRPFPWDESMWDKEIFSLYKKLVRLRKALPDISYGAFSIKYADKDFIVYKSGSTIITVNRGKTSAQLDIRRVISKSCVDIVSNNKYSKNDIIVIEPYSAAVLLENREYDKIRGILSC